MLSKKSFGIAGAAMLGTVALLGTNAANAAINLDASAETEMKAAVTFAMETITAEVESDMAGTFYQVRGRAVDNEGDSQLDVESASGVGAAQDETLIIEYTLDGMVFGDALSDGSIELRARDEDGDLIDTDQLMQAGERVLRRGGGVGESTAVFHISNGDGTISQAGVLLLRIPTAGVSMEGGSIMVSVRHELDDDDDAETASRMGAVQLGRGIDEDAEPNSPMTFVARVYRDFGLTEPDAEGDQESIYVDTVGSLVIGVTMGYLNAQDGMPLMLEDMIDEDGEMTRVEFSGMFGFAEDVYLASTDGCETVGFELLVANTETTDPDDMMMVKATLQQLIDSPNLCIMVPSGDDAIMIPRTDYYMATTTYTVAVDIADTAKHPAMGMDIMLGKIVRDGTIVHLPYLTTAPKFVQRLVIVNRNAGEVAYSIEYTEEADKPAMPEEGMDSGMVDGDMTTIMKIADMVIVDGKPPRTSATLTLESVPTMIDVATIQINPMMGTTDTIVYEAE